MTDADLLRAVIARHDVSVNRFAAEVLVRDARTVRRWLSGEQSLPAAVRRWLESQLEDNAE